MTEITPKIYIVVLQYVPSMYRNIPLLAKGSWTPIIEAFAKLTVISSHALFGLCGSSYVILSIASTFV